MEFLGGVYIKIYKHSVSSNKSENKQNSHNYSRNTLFIMGAFEYCVGQYGPSDQLLTTKQKDILNTQLFANIKQIYKKPFLLTL